MVRTLPFQGRDMSSTLVGATMFNDNDYWFWDNAIPKETCDKILNAYPSDKWRDATIKEDLRQLESGVVKPSSRISKTMFITDEWIFHMVHDFIESANNQSGWKYDIQSMESMQLTKYNKGGYYGWHKDGKSDHFGKYKKPDDPSVDGFVRKLSMTILLNGDYEGGDFQFRFADPKKHNLDKVGPGMKSNTVTPKLGSTGSVIVFPSYQLHRVKPITKGTRYSLVAWALGPPFK
jgi:PKHD-type hydroxylase